MSHPTPHETFLRRSARLAILAGLLGSLTASSAPAQLVVSDSKVGYIDSAIPATQFRLRMDAAYTSEFADRVEFQYAKYGQPGAPLAEIEIDSHQELAAYFEYSPLNWFSVFAEVPFRLINPVLNDNTSGLYDVNAGAKLALYHTDSSLFTAQLRTHMATGDIDAGLSAGHASLEPALLYLQRWTDRLTVEAELRNWIPIDASTTGPGRGGGGGGGGGGGMGGGGRREFSSNVLRYGVGVGYTLCEDSYLTVTPVTEVVGWHVFDGLKSTAGGDRISAQDDHIVNLKLGVRMDFINDLLPIGESNSVYVGYGKSLTSHVWYKDIVRLEFRMRH